MYGDTMSLALGGAPYGFNYVAADQQDGLNVAASIYDITTGTPSFVSKTALQEIISGSYFGIFTPVIGKLYAVITLVYLDPGFTTLDPDRAPGTETIQAVDLSGGGGGGDLTQIAQLVATLQNILKTLGLGNSLTGILEVQEVACQVEVPELAGIISAQEVLNC